MRPYEYRIVSTSAARSRSSEPQRLELNKVFFAWFQISAMIRPDGYQVRLARSLKPGTSQCTVVKEATARGMIGGRVVTTKERFEQIDVVVKYAAGNEETYSINLRR